MYTNVTFEPIETKKQKNKFLLLLIVYGFLSCIMHHCFDITVAECVLLILGLSSVSLFFYTEKLFLSLYQWFSAKVSLLQPILKTKDGSKTTYLPIPHLSNHIYWINSYINKQINSTKEYIFIFPLTLSHSTQGTELTNVEKSLYELYKLQYTFANPEKKMLFFILTFFIYVLLYFCFIFSFTIIYFYLIQLIKDTTYLLQISFFIFLLVVTFGYFIYSYVSMFHLPFTDKDMKSLSNNLELSKQFRVYFYDGYSVQCTKYTPSDIVTQIAITKKELMQTINAILQIAIPILFLSMISISIALFNNFNNNAF